MRKAAVVLITAAIVIVGGASSAHGSTCVTAGWGPDSVTVCTP